MQGLSNHPWPAAPLLASTLLTKRDLETQTHSPKLNLVQARLGGKETLPQFELDPGSNLVLQVPSLHAGGASLTFISVACTSKGLGSYTRPSLKNKILDN